MADNPTKHSLTEAVEGQVLPASGAEAGKPGTRSGQSATPDRVAEETRRPQEARSHGRPDRGDLLVNVGRGEQTHG